MLWSDKRNCGCLNVFFTGRSSQWPSRPTFVKKVTCCFVSNDARISLNVVVVADDEYK